jgi:hypothetical protein
MGYLSVIVRQRQIQNRLKCQNPKKKLFLLYAQLTVFHKVRYDTRPEPVMHRNTTWNIHDLDGHYLGQSVAFAAETAFCQYMRLLGIRAVETDVEIEIIYGDSIRLTFRSAEFFITPQYVQPHIPSSESHAVMH